MSQNKGFTLIELLVVIAIIGILAAAALASLGSARTKGQQAAIRSQVANMRAQAELYFSNNNNYGTGYTGTITSTGAAVLPTASCATTNTAATSMFGATSANGGLDGLIKGACSSGATAITAYVDAATATKWAIKAAMPGTMEVCADSSGNSKTAATVTVTAAVCI